MNHLPWLLERGLQPGGYNGPCGHALMASCPPEPFSQLTANVPFGYSHGNGHTHGNGHAIQPPVADGPRTWELSKGDLATLLDLSKRLDLDGEITPVMAWGMILGHGRLGELRVPDFVRIADELGTKMRCYGWVVPVSFGDRVLTEAGLGPSWRSLRCAMRWRVCWLGKMPCSIGSQAVFVWGHC